MQCLRRTEHDVIYYDGNFCRRLHPRDISNECMILRNVQQIRFFFGRSSFDQKITFVSSA